MVVGAILLYAFFGGGSTGAVATGVAKHVTEWSLFVLGLIGGRFVIQWLFYCHEIRCCDFPYSYFNYIYAYY